MYPINKEKIDNIIQLLKPDKRNLLKLISSKITQEILVDIANADYGYKAEENLVALRGIAENYQIPTNKILDYEILSLTRHLEPHTEIKIGEYNQHLERAFCCTILITANTLQDDNYCTFLSDNDDYNLIQLIESCNYLGKDFLLALISFLVWQMNEEGFYFDDKVNTPLFLFALIYLLLKTDYSIAETDLKILVDNLNFVQSDNYYQNWWEFGKLHKAHLKWIKLTEELNILAMQLKDENLKKELQKMIDLILLNNKHAK